ncbi:MAG: 3-5-bisphosphate nucleotidase [Candidatus Eremiobacteraeota bacterium]|nr:3-5-bisphosphate nucleotidase [Candidatus Eremiobacteraeota bacterium]
MTGTRPLSADDLTALLEDVRRAAVHAGDAIVALARDGACETWRKADESPLTAADLAAHEIIDGALRELDPDTLVISEESVCALDALPRRFWLVDPLDGTREFLAGNGEYTVNVALVEDGVPVLGVVHAPARGATYAAARGAGATCSDARGSTAIRAASDGALVVVASRSHPSPSLDEFLAQLAPHAVLELGSSLKLCLVADGTAHIYPRLGPTSWWDTAAAHAVVLESGAHVCTLDGAPLRYDGRGVLNPSFVCTSLPYAAWAAAARSIA